MIFEPGQTLIESDKIFALGKDRWEAFLATEDIDQCEGILLCPLSDGMLPLYRIILVGKPPDLDCKEFFDRSKSKLPNLKYLFINSPVNAASTFPRCILECFPGLHTLEVYDLVFEPAIKPIRHIGLNSLVIRGKRLSGKFFRCLSECVFPVLEELTICPESLDETQGSVSMRMSAKLTREFLLADPFPFPSLRKLGLLSCDDTDEYLQLLSESALLKQLESIDVSGGTLGDKGVELILHNPSFHHLKKIESLPYAASVKKVMELEKFCEGRNIEHYLRRGCGSADRGIL